MASCVNCEWGLWTNGKYREVLRKVKTLSGSFEFVKFNDIPDATGSIEDIEKPKRSKLKKAVADNLLFVFKTCHNHIYATDGPEKQAAFFEMLKLIFCKIEDKRNLSHALVFYATSTEQANPDGQLLVKNRIRSIFEQVKKKYSAIFQANELIGLKPRSLAWIVSELQSYSLLNTHIDIKGKAYEEIVGENLRGDKGQFFTPRNIMHMAVKMINPTSKERVLDRSCGTGGFLVSAMSHVIASLEKSVEAEFSCPKDQWTDEHKSYLQASIQDIAARHYFGFDIAPELVKATKMNMVMNNDGSGNILECNSLLPPHEWDIHYPGLREALKRAVHDPTIRFTNHNKIAFADVIVTNPPFGSKIPIKDKAILEQFELAHIWKKPKEKGESWVMTERLQSSVSPEQLFIERCLQFLKPGGRMAIVLPDSILGSPGLAYIRQWLLRKTMIIASIDLHADTFQPNNGTQTSVLILQKKTAAQVYEELKTGYHRPYPIFMVTVEYVGHDRRGNIIFKRDEAGNEMLVPEQQTMESADMLDQLPLLKQQSFAKIINDQTLDIPKAFEDLKKKEGITW